MANNYLMKLNEIGMPQVKQPEIGMVPDIPPLNPQELGFNLETLMEVKQQKESQSVPQIDKQPSLENVSTEKEDINKQRRINQQFGNPNPALYGPGGWNRGADISYEAGEPQYAPPEGEWVVVEANDSGSFNTGWGNSVVIQNKKTGEKIRRSHFDKVLVKPGEIVTGKALGTTGRTGRTTGYHADVEYINPQGQLANYLNSPYGKYL